jgi:hypothetical protein
MSIVEHTASALFDQAIHTAIPVTSDDEVEDIPSINLENEQFKILHRRIKDIDSFEKELLETLDMPDGLIMRHRPGHFNRTLSLEHRLDIAMLMCCLRLISKQLIRSYVLRLPLG